MYTKDKIKNLSGLSILSRNHFSRISETLFNELDRVQKQLCVHFSLLLSSVFEQFFLHLLGRHAVSYSFRVFL